MYRLIIGQKSTGKIYDVTNTVEEVSITTERKSAAGRLTFTWLKVGEEVSYHEGDIVRFEDDGQVIFYGWVFNKKKDRWNKFTVTCYDRLRYLKASASYAFYGMTASEILREITEDFQLDLGDVADTGYKIPSLIKNNQSCLDIIQNALDLTLLNTGKVFVLYDNGTGLSLKASEDWISNYVIGDKSFLGDYDYTTDIDSSTFNSIKLTQPNQQTGRTEAVVVQDSYNIGRWGLLQQYTQVNGNYNTAQLTAMAQQMLENSNRRKRTFSAEALGVTGLRAGMLLRMDITGLGDIDRLNQYVLLEQVTHHYSNDKHTMQFETLEI